jgi:uncharacterized protein
MILTRDSSQGDYEIKSYEKGQFKINDSFYSESILIGLHVLLPWQPQCFDELSLTHLKPLLDYHPTIILLGTGEKLIFPPAPLLNLFYENEVGIEVMDTLAACRTFNVLISEGRNVIAALLIR